MMHPACELRWVSDEIGQGVFAREAIPRGTVTYARDELDQLLSAERVASLPPVLRTPIEYFSFILADGTHVLCWDSGRFVNHACEPTSRGLGLDYEIAIRDIAAGEQVTSDYAELNIMTSFVCRCGSPGCRGGVGPQDLFTYGERWDALVAEALPLMLRVEQPLWPLVTAQQELLAAARGDGKLASRISYRYPGVGQPGAGSGAAGPSGE